MIKAVIFDMYETLITHFESPVYFSMQIAKDLEMALEDFVIIWRSTEEDRTKGKLTFGEVIERILRANDCYDEEKVRMVSEKRVQYKRENFNHLHKEIIPMLQKLKELGIKVGLVSNCYLEEAMVIRESVLFPYFDSVCMSCEEGVAKPESEIFKRCMERLEVEADECLYVGDGGSHELEAAIKLDMYAMQAVWYLKEGTLQPMGPMEEYEHLNTPMDIIDIISRR